MERTSGEQRSKCCPTVCIESSSLILTSRFEVGARIVHGWNGSEASMVDSLQGDEPAMQAHRIHLVVPEDHRATIQFPATIPSGPVELIVLVPPEEERKPRAEASQGRGSLAALA